MNTPDGTALPDGGQRGNEVHSRLSDAVLLFVRSQLGLKPAAIFVDEHGASITVTLKGVLSDSERNAAKDKRTAELIARAMKEAFRSVAGLLVAASSTALGKTVDEATFFLDPHSNYAAIVLTLDNDTNT